MQMCTLYKFETYRIIIYGYTIRTLIPEMDEATVNRNFRRLIWNNNLIITYDPNNDQ